MTSEKVFVGESKKTGFTILAPGKNLFTGVTKFEEHFGPADTLENDLFNLAAGVFATDLSIKRLERELYIRNIELEVEVVNLHLFERIKKEMEAALFIVSKDNWRIKFIQKTGIPVTNFTWDNKEGAILLFSGGIDSMAAASEFISTKKPLVLVSHNTHGNRVVEGNQTNVHDALEKFYKQKIEHINIKVYGRNHVDFPFAKDELRENTQRTRSFLFLTLAALVTRRKGFNRILYMAENGQFAIHLPLNAARVGPFSTHTADPEFVASIQNIFRILLSNSNFEIANPFLYKTKAEVFSVMPQQLQKDAHLSASCWMISRLGKHCGYCIPCISRRIAVEYNGHKFNEYETDIFNSDLNIFPDTDDRKRNLVDYLEFISKFEKISSSNKQNIQNEFPELYNPIFDLEATLKLYNRVYKQSMDVISKYPNIQKIL